MILKQPIGLLGGTFDPVHKGHIGIANHVLYRFNLANIQWIPCNQPAHRALPVASPADRLAMLKLATDDNDAFLVNDVEIQRGGISYMVETLETLRPLYPNTPFCLILGADAFAHLNQWHRWEALLSHAHIIVINRANYALPDKTWLKTLCKTHQTNDVNALHNNLSGKIYFETINPIVISATEIRHQLKNNQKPAGTLPSAVYKYIVANGLYNGKT